MLVEQNKYTPDYVFTERTYFWVCYDLYHILRRSIYDSGDHDNETDGLKHLSNPKVNCLTSTIKAIK